MIVGLLVNEVKSGPERIRFEGEEGPLHISVAGARDHLRRPKTVRIYNPIQCYPERIRAK